MRGAAQGWRRSALPLGLGMMLVAFNLRPALTTVGPLLTTIRAETSLGAGGAALLTTLPVVCLGLASAVGPLVTRRLGIDRGILLAVAIVAVGLGLRIIKGLGPLFVGACVAAAGIGLAGVLMPTLVKRDFPRSVGPVMGLYTMVLCLGAAAGAGLAVPLRDALGTGWSPALALWAVPAALATLAWMPFARRVDGAAASTARPNLWSDRLAWTVTGYVGLQSSLAYVAFGWLPAVLESRGFGAVEAGFLASAMSLGQAPGALIVPALAARLRDQRLLAAALLVLTALALLGLVYAPTGLAGTFAVALGVGLGGSFGLALTLIVLRSRGTESAAALSAMAQSVGYTVAAFGPLGFGLIHEATGGWSGPAALFCAFALAAMLCGLGAGREGTVGGR